MSDQNRQALNEFMNKKGLKVSPWCNSASIAESTLRNFLKGASNSLTVDKLSKLGRAADAVMEIQDGILTISDSGNVELSSHNPIYAPLISWVQAGEFTECFDPYEKGDYAEMVTVNAYDKPTVIALRVVGNSMDKLAPEGSIIIVDYADKELVDGKFYVLRLNRNNETTFKRYRADPMLLEPFSNGNYKPIIPDGNIEVVGRVVEVTIITP